MARKPSRRLASERQPAVEPAVPATSSASKHIVWVCAALAAVTLAVYAQTASHGFIHLDDEAYVTENSVVQHGLTATGIAWALTTFAAANWHPLTWLSHMLDCQLFGLNAGNHHLVSAVLHAASAVLLLLALFRATRRLWPSTMVAAIFALQPTHVESVAWVAERKDVLSGLMAMATLWCYVRYAESPNVRRYLWVAIMFALGLLAKPMLVTMPFLLLLLDYWPLERWKQPRSWQSLRPLVWEKLPLLALVVADSFVTVAAQKAGGAVGTLEQLSLAARLSNAIVSYARYLGKAIWPVDLGVYYPMHNVSTAAVLGAALLLLAITGLAVWRARNHPSAVVGWLWFLGTLVPVIGLVQVGTQAMADRYTYIPYIGLSIAVVWWIADALAGRPELRKGVVAAAAAALVLLAAVSYRQAAYWKDSEKLFQHTLAITHDNYLILNNLGTVYAEQGRREDAAKAYLESLRIRPEFGDTHANLGHELMKQGQFERAFMEFNQAIRINPKSYPAHAGLGVLFTAAHQPEEARREMEAALRISPDKGDTQNNLCNVLVQLGRPAEAAEHCRYALQLDPNLPNAHFNLGNALAAQGRKSEALAEYNRALALDPGNAAARAAIEKLQQ